MACDQSFLAGHVLLRCSSLLSVPLANAAVVPWWYKRSWFRYGGRCVWLTARGKAYSTKWVIVKGLWNWGESFYVPSALFSFRGEDGWSAWRSASLTYRVSSGDRCNKHGEGLTAPRSLCALCWAQPEPALVTHTSSNLRAWIAPSNLRGRRIQDSFHSTLRCCAHLWSLHVDCQEFLENIYKGKRREKTFPNVMVLQKGKDPSIPCYATL